LGQAHGDRKTLRHDVERVKPKHAAASRRGSQKTNHAIASLIGDFDAQIQRVPKADG
jgi:hypothetical protein